MRAGILTFHRASNYGAVLQTWALQQSLTNLGFEAKIIDYRTPQVEYDHRPRYAYKRYGLLRGIKNLGNKVRRAQVFDAFRERALIQTSEYTTYELPSIANMFDFFVVGSDQVWNETWGALDSSLFLSFANEKQRYSYACSFGTESPDKHTLDVCKKYLPTFSGVSLREDSGRVFVEEKLGIPARNDLDPVLLMGADKWESFCDLPEERGYILVYTVPRPVNLLDFARRLGKNMGKKVVYLNNELFRACDLRHERYVSPERFVGWIRNASVVLTNSFHGTAFSIVFKKQFLVETQTGGSFNNRSRELLNLCGLSYRTLDDRYKDDVSAVDEPIQWEEPFWLLNEAKKSSLRYLNSMNGSY